MINRAIEETLNLRRVEINGHDPMSARGMEQISNQASRDRLAATVLLVLACVRIERHDNGDALGRGTFQRIHHDQLFHRPLIDRCCMTLDHEGVAAAHRLVKSDVDLGVGVRDRARRNELDVHQPGNLVGQVGMSASREQHEMFVVRARETAHDGSFCSSAASAARAVLVPARFRATQPGRCAAGSAHAKITGPTSPVIVEPAAMYAPSAISTGAAEPSCCRRRSTPQPSSWTCVPVVVGEDHAGPMLAPSPITASPR
jgi:hypothetical protein